MDSEKQDQQLPPLPKPERPNESTGIYVRGFIKISDPETGKVLVETAN